MGMGNRMSVVEAGLLVRGMGLGHRGEASPLPVPYIRRVCANVGSCRALGTTRTAMAACACKQAAREGLVC